MNIKTKRIMKMKYTDEMLEGKICPYCNCGTTLVPSEHIYGSNNFPGLFFLQCTANKDHYVGTRNNGKAHGTLADKDLRLLRRTGHGLFDPLWKRGPEKKFRHREAAYSWLSTQMNLPKSLTHFGMFDSEQCLLAISIMKDFIKNN